MLITTSRRELPCSLSLRGFALSFFLLAAATASAVSQNSEEAKAFSLSFRKAIACVSEAASKASFERKQIDPVPREVLEQCATERETAIQDMAKAIPNSDQTYARDNVSAKMRMTAQEGLIARLEAGESPSADDESGLGLEKAAARYISCIRLAINHRLEGVYVGQDWASEVKSMPENRLQDFFVGIGRTACQSSSRIYTNTLNTALKVNVSKMKRSVEENWGTPKIERLGVAPYIRMASNLRQKIQ